MKLFHVSDVHFGAEDPKALDWFARCVADEAPDAVIMTGDLTMRAKPDGSEWVRTQVRVTAKGLTNLAKALSAPAALSTITHH